MKLLIFDIDGTLLTAGGVGRSAFNAAIKDIYGLDEAWGDTVAHGKTDPQLVEEIITRETGRRPSPDETARLLAVYVEFFAQHIADSPRFRILEGVEKLLHALSLRDDVLLGIGTGNLEATAQMKLRRGNLEHYFSYGGFGSDSICRKELIQRAVERGKAKLRSTPDDIVIIGDAPQDVQAGLAAGAKVLGVATGRASVGELQAEGAEVVFEDLSCSNSFLSFLENLP